MYKNGKPAKYSAQIKGNKDRFILKLSWSPFWRVGECTGNVCRPEQAALHKET